MRRLQISQKEAQKLIDTGRVSKDGQPILDKSATVSGEIEVVVFEPASRGLAPIFETREFALFDKPSGVMVHPRNRKTHYSLIDEVRHRYGPQANIVHRLDKETSGLVLVSKNKRTEKELKALFESKKIEKRYLALVRGDLDRALTIDAPIAQNVDRSIIKLKVTIDPAGKPAVTLVRPLRRYGGYTLVEARPLTGRQHQIRVHLFHVKHPIVGDPIYGVDAELAIAYLDGRLDRDERIRMMGAERLMLHAYSLEFDFRNTRYRLFSRFDFFGECERVIAS